MRGTHICERVAAFTAGNQPFTKHLSKSPDPTIAKSIANLQNAQDKLYTSLVKHGVTAQDITQINQRSQRQKPHKNYTRTIGYSKENYPLTCFRALPFSVSFKSE